MYHSEAWGKSLRPRVSVDCFVDKRVGLINKVSIESALPGDPAVYISRVRMSNYMQDSEKPAYPGAGTSLDGDRARQAAICEGLERYCQIEADSDQFIVGSYADLSTRFHTLPPSVCQLYHPTQYGRIRPKPFNNETVVSWTWAYSLTQRKPILVPACLVYLNYPHHCEESLIWRPISTGAACGQGLSDAVCRGICEVVERDAFTIMWLNKHSCPRIIVDPRSILGDVLKRRFKSNLLSYTLIWMTNDVPVHACLAILLRKHRGTMQCFAGAAAHLDPKAAVLNALCELQKGARTAWHEPPGQRILRAQDVCTPGDHALYYTQQDRTTLVDFLVNNPNSVKFEELKNLSRNDSVLDLQTCLRFCEEAGLEVIVSDLTPDHIRPSGLRAVKVIIPGMQPLVVNHNEPPLGCPRLYEVPVRVGWLRQPIKVSEFNSDPHPFP